MADPAPADEAVVETEPGVDPNQLNPHMGDQVPEEPEGEPGADEEGGETPSPSEETAEKKPDDQPKEDDAVLQKKVGELAFENRQLKRQLEAQQQSEEETEPEPLKTLKDFDYNEQEFNAYLVGVAKEQAKSELARESKAETVKTEAQRREDEFAAREDAFEAENPGFKERLHAEDLRISEEMAVFIADPGNDVGLHVGDYLSRNKAEAARIAGLQPADQFREMVKLEDRISKEVAKAEAEKKKASEAPEPPASPVDGTDPGVGDTDPTDPKSDELDDDEWLRRRNKQLEARRKG